MKKIVSILFLFVFFICDITTKAQTNMKPLSQLLINKSDTWSLIKKQIQKAKNPVTILPKNAENADRTLYQAQVTINSPMGAVIYETGGILIDSGWIRILGSGSRYLNRNVMKWNKGKSFSKWGERPSFILIADDVLGGFYAINGGGIDTIGIGEVFYFSPDDARWSNLQLSYSGFLNFCFQGNLAEYYKNLRWVSWKKDIKKMNGDSGFITFPFLWSKEGRNINKTTKKIVPINYLWDLYFKGETTNN
ncbi:DUF2625 family protein [Filimonas effusa]|uniref:DUF2625 family protein n=1 Tax=Filimonas effusa TaxID=2508721 RepID=A0A4V1MAP8_9BACT|nr:DUF2625 family protein [Filimonas effusa]RXK86626.1 DUF2625 family protein [Filimonas effusa]